MTDLTDTDRPYVRVYKTRFRLFYSLILFHVTLDLCHAWCYISRIYKSSL